MFINKYFIWLVGGGILSLGSFFFFWLKVPFLDSMEGRDDSFYILNEKNVGQDNLFHVLNNKKCYQK